METLQSRHAPAGFILSSWQSEGISIPSDLAAVSIVVPSVNWPSWPLMLALIMGFEQKQNPFCYASEIFKILAKR
jgi:hypothetical protein